MIYRLYRWLWPDGFIGDDETSRRNVILLAEMLLLAVGIIVVVPFLFGAVMFVLDEATHMVGR